MTHSIPRRRSNAFKSSAVIRTARGDVRLSALTLACAARMYGWMLDREVYENIGLRGEPSLRRTRAWIRSALRDRTVRPFAIRLSGRHVGNVVLDRIDDHLGTARLSVYIGEAAARGAGVGRAAVRLAVERAFDQLGLHKVWLTVHARNGRAISSYLLIGFQIEGVHRDEFLLRGRRLPLLYMGCLRGDLKRR